MGRLGLLLVAVGLVVIGGAAAGVYAQSTSTVVMTEFAFNPSRLTGSAGRDTVTLQNGGRFPHNLHIEGNGVSLDVKSDGPVASGESFTGTVNLPAGTYDIWCPVGNHREQGMVGTMTVAGQAAGGAAQVPAALPRTGDAESGPPIAAAMTVLGLALVSAGWMVRRRGRSEVGGKA
jgi:LPXTG-motif cell wall-anchored protein